MKTALEEAKIGILAGAILIAAPITTLGVQAWTVDGTGANVVILDTATAADLGGYGLAITGGSDDVVFVDAIPLGATGKMQKNKLREQFRNHKLPTA